MSKTWQIGAASRKITPPVGGQLAGFDARVGGSTGVHDDLYAHALVIGSSEVRAALVSVEVIAVSKEFASRVRAAVEEETGIPAKNVILAATHTHCGPVTLHHFFNQGQPLDEQYLNELANGIVLAVVAADRAKADRKLKTGLVNCESVAKNRRTADEKPIDPMVGVLLAEELDGTPYAIALSYACHTTVLGPNTLEISGDFPHYTLEYLRVHLGAGVHAMYFNGAEGDLSIGHKSDLSAVGIIDPYRTFATAQKIGYTLAEAVLAGLTTLEPVEGELAVASTVVSLPLKSYAPLEEMRAERIHAASVLESAKTKASGQVTSEFLRVKQKSLFTRIEEYYAFLHEQEPGAAAKLLPAEMIAIRLENTVILSLPGEIFVGVALRIRELSPFAKTMFLGLANDYIGYLPSEGAKEGEGYEVVASRVTNQAWQQLVEAAVQLLHEVGSVVEKGVA